MDLKWTRTWTWTRTRIARSFSNPRTGTPAPKASQSFRRLEIVLAGIDFRPVPPDWHALWDAAGDDAGARRRAAAEAKAKAKRKKRADPYERARARLARAK